MSAESVKRRSKVLTNPTEPKRKKVQIKQHTQEEVRKPTRTLRTRDPNVKMLGDQPKEVRQQVGTGKMLTRRTPSKLLKIVHRDVSNKDGKEVTSFLMSDGRWVASGALKVELGAKSNQLLNEYMSTIKSDPENDLVSYQ